MKDFVGYGVLGILAKAADGQPVRDGAADVKLQSLPGTNTLSGVPMDGWHHHALMGWKGSVFGVERPSEPARSEQSDPGQTEAGLFQELAARRVGHRRDDFNQGWGQTTLDFFTGDKEDREWKDLLTTDEH